MIPVRCFTCGAVIADKQEKFEEAVKKGEKPAAVLDKLGVKRYCCRRMFLAYVSVMEELIKYGRF